MGAVGKGKDSEGSEWIIKVLDKDDSRPVWIPVWGGANCLAQALWKVQMTRSPEEVKKFVSKIRMYTISDQDDTGPWIRKTFPDLFYVGSPGYHAGGYHYATWSGISGDKFHGRFVGADFAIVDNPWLDETSATTARWGPSTLYQISDGRRYAHFSGTDRKRIERCRTSRIRRLGWTVRAVHASYAQIFYEPETRPIYTDAMDEVKGTDGSLIQAIKPPCGGGARPFNTILPPAWTGPSNPTKKPITHRWPN